MPFVLIRPDDWNLPLFLHVLGAMVLMGALVAVVTALLAAWNDDDVDRVELLRRFGLRFLLYGVLPGFLVMRISAEWIRDKEFGDTDSEPDWIGVGYGVADLGALFLIVSIVLTAVAVRRARRQDADGRTLARVAGVLTALLLVLNVVAVWAMTAKPG